MRVDETGKQVMFNDLTLGTVCRYNGGVYIRMAQGAVNLRTGCHVKIPELGYVTLLPNAKIVLGGDDDLS